MTLSPDQQLLLDGCWDEATANGSCQGFPSKNWQSFLVCMDANLFCWGFHFLSSGFSSTFVLRRAVPTHKHSGASGLRRAPSSSLYCDYVGRLHGFDIPMSILNVLSILQLLNTCVFSTSGGPVCSLFEQKTFSLHVFGSGPICICSRCLVPAL